MNSGPINARHTALKVINEVANNGAYANIALANEINRHTLTSQDRRFLTELVYGTVKAGKTLDWLLSHYISRPLDSIPPVIRNILRMGIYQIFFLDKIPVSAACNESVKLAKKYGHPGTVKFVNAVLRTAATKPDKAAYPNKETNMAQYLALKYFHPEWLICRWLTRLGAAATEQLCQINNQTPPLIARTNTLKTTRDMLMEILAAEGVTCQPSNWTPEGIVFQEFPSLSSLSSLKQGQFQVQDESSMLVAHVLAPLPGETIIDACAAPGGKSTHIAALMKNKGKVIATDIHEHKLALIEDNASRLGIHIIEAKQLDATNLHSYFPDQADRVLVDAPCSGLGVIRRKPDSRWRKNEEQLSQLPELQYRILESAAKCVKPNGVLVYSTCTTEPEENQNIIEKFLHNNPAFSLQETGQFLPIKRQGSLIQLWPHLDGTDGFFIARLIRMKQVVRD